jgi:hypothetical protein
LRTNFCVLGTAFIVFCWGISPLLAEDVSGRALPSFVSSSSFDGFAAAVRDTESANRTRLAAETISEMFSETDRPNSQLVAVSEKRDEGPTIALSDQNRSSTVVPSTDLPTVTVSQIVERPRRVTVLRKETRRPKTLLRIATLQKAPSSRDYPTGTGNDHDSGPAMAPQSMQPLLSNCKKMTPECLANRAWCGC